MKNTLILVTLFLSGCSLIPSKFDSSVYDHLVTLSVMVDEASQKCGTLEEPALVRDINHESKLALKYTQYTSGDLSQPIKILDKTITEMNTMYAAGTPSVAYCKAKYGVIDLELQEILKATGEKDK